jgi:hypothetical protein
VASRWTTVASAGPLAGLVEEKYRLMAAKRLVAKLAAARPVRPIPERTGDAAVP